LLNKTADIRVLTKIIPQKKQPNENNKFMSSDNCRLYMYDI